MAEPGPAGTLAASMMVSTPIPPTRSSPVSFTSDHAGHPRAGVGRRPLLRGGFPARGATRRLMGVPLSSPHDAMAHGGHSGMSMADMVADMRRRFLAALVLSVPILLWSPIGREVLGFEVPAPFGLRDDVFSLLLSVPVVFWAGWIFFDGAARALRHRTLDMMVLVAVAIGAGWLYSLAITLTAGAGGLLRGSGGAHDVRAARALVRDAGARRRQRRDPHPAGARARQGAGAARRRLGRGRHAPRSRSATSCWSARARRSRLTGSSRTACRRSTSRW